MDVELPDGRVIQGVPDGMSRADLVAKLKANGHDVTGLEGLVNPGPMDRLKTRTGAVGRELQNLTLGAVRGAGSIGSTLMAAAEQPSNLMTGKGLSLDADKARRQDMTDATQALGADPNSLAYRAGKLGGEVAGTAGAGGVLASGARGLGAAPAFVNALASNGFRTGVALPTAQNLAVRSGAGALAGGAQVGLADPEHAGTGAILGAVTPVAAQGLGSLASNAGEALRSGAENMMARALKASPKAKRTGDEATAIRTLLDNGLNVSKAGVEKLRGMIDDLNTQISDKIGASTAQIDPQRVVNALGSTEQRFANQVAPTADLNSIAGVKQDFLNNAGAGPIPVQLAQKVKQGTYGVLRDKFGQLGTADTEAQKGLARGLKDEIAAAVPDVGSLNAKESELLATLGVTERAAGRSANKNLLGLAGLAVTHPAEFAAFMADRSPVAQSLIARSLNALGRGMPAGVNALAGPAAFRAIPSTARTGLQAGPGSTP